MNLKDTLKQLYAILILQEGKKTSAAWYNYIKYCKVPIEILDPDGWDRSNFNYSFNIEEISNKEFYNRLTNSSIQWRK